MSESFQRFRLGELTEIIAGGDKPKIFSENKTSKNTIPVFANAEGNNGLQGYTDLPRIIEPAVTIAARGSKVGFAALRKQPFFPIVRLLTLIPQQDKLDVDYLFYNLKLNRQNGTGSGQPQITIPEISDKIISIPPILAQQKIAKVLSDLDAKIEVNNKINAELEAMAKLIYDYWFVQFEFPCLPQDYRPSGQVNPNSLPQDYRPSGQVNPNSLPQDYRPSGQVNPNFDLSEKIRSFCTYKQTGGLPLPDGKSWFVYVLLCNDGSFYKGMTNDLYRRYYEHGTGQGAHHTKVHKPVKVIHWEQFDTQEEAALREKELKTGFGRTWLQREYEKLQKQQVKPGSPAHQNARLSKLMPAGKMVWNEELKREVPEGWEVNNILEIAELLGGGTQRQRKKVSGMVIFLSILPPIIQKDSIQF